MWCSCECHRFFHRGSTAIQHVWNPIGTMAWYTWEHLRKQRALFVKMSVLRQHHKLSYDMKKGQVTNQHCPLIFWSGSIRMRQGCAAFFIHSGTQNPFTWWSRGGKTHLKLFWSLIISEQEDWSVLLLPYINRWKGSNNATVNPSSIKID